jgi:Flp pilus assembly pilin Flp
MSAIKSIFARLHRDKRGATMVEYSVLIALITAALIVIIGSVATQMTIKWGALAIALGAAPPA